MKQSNGIILIIDDNEQVIRAIQGPLTFCGFQVVTATEAKRAIEVASEIKPDLVILDLKLPGTNGVEFLKKYRSVEKDVPVILLTGYYNEFKEQIKPEMNVFGYLPKRFYRQELEKMVYDAIKKPETDRTFSKTATARILIVDDEEEITSLMKDFFRERGYVAITACRASEAIDLNQHFRADIVIADIKMPGGMDGIDMVTELRKSEVPPKFAFFVTGVGDNQEMLNKMRDKLGKIEPILNKPLQMETMEKLAKEAEEQLRKSKTSEDEKK